MTDYITINNQTYRYYGWTARPEEYMQQMERVYDYNFDDFVFFPAMLSSGRYYVKMYQKV